MTTAHLYQHDYTPTHSFKPGYLANAERWCEKAYARHRALPEDACYDEVICVVGAIVLLEAHKAACYDRWQYEQMFAQADECTCFLSEQTCPTCAPAHDENEPIPF